MEDEHIVQILESNPLNGLSESDAATVRAHVAGCDDCRRAFEAAQISSLLIRERAAADIEPPPFFETRVMAAWRERQAATETSVLRRLWRATGALVSGMAATVAALAVLTFAVPSPETASPDTVSAFNPYSAEDVLLARGDGPGDDLSYDEVLTTIYESDEDAER